MREEPTPGGKGVKLPGKKSSSLSHLLSPVGLSYCHNLWGCSWQKRQQCKKEVSPTGWEDKGRAARKEVMVRVVILNKLH